MAAELIVSRPPRTLLTATGLGLLALMASGPFLWPIHTPPIAGFWSEWWAGALGLSAAIVLLAAPGRALPLPTLLGIPAALLLALLLQAMLGRLAFPQVGLLYSAYLLWAGLLLILGRYLAETIGIERLAALLACAMALGALAGALIALAQWRGIAAGVPWIFPHLGGGVYANLGQPNHHAQYSWLGIASLFYLRGRGWLYRPLFWLAVLAIALGSVLGGSRSVLLYPMILVAAVLWTRRREPDGPAAALLVDASLLLPVVLALAFLVSWAPPPGADATAASAPAGAAVTSVSRLYQSVEGPSIRLALARTAWTAFLAHPWLGQGAGNYPWASFVAAASRTGEEPFQVAENAHNFILHGMAEFGAPTAAVVLLLLLLWAKGFLGRPWGLAQFWCGAILGIGATHALFEYPLWYAYFLGPTALLLGATDRSVISLGGPRVSVYLVLAGFSGLVILTNLRLDYSVIEAASNQPLAADPDRERAWQISMERLKVLHRESLLSPWALLAFAELAEPSRQRADDRATLCERGIRFAPARSLLTRCAMQLAIAGRDGDAQKLVQAVLRAFPAERSTTADELAKGAEKYPEVLPLSRLSLRE